MAILYRKKTREALKKVIMNTRVNYCDKTKVQRSYFDEGNGVGIVSFCHDVSVVIPLRMTSSGLASV